MADTGFDNDLIEALIEVESSHDPKAFNPSSGARGLTQITPIAWKDLTAHYPDKYSKLDYERVMFKPEVAIQAGKDYLKIIQGYLKNYSMPITIDNILASYNWGVGNLKKYGLHNAPAETKTYIAKIRQLLQPTAEQLDARY